MQLNHLSVSTVKKIVELSKLAKKANNEREKATTDGIGDITTTQEQKNLIEAVRALSPEQKKELCGLMWLGRDDDEDRWEEWEQSKPKTSRQKIMQDAGRTEDASTRACFGFRRLQDVRFTISKVLV